LDRDSAILDPTELAQPLHESGSPFTLDRSRGGAQEPDHRQLARLLRARRERPRRCRAAEKGDEIAPSQTIDPHVPPGSRTALHPTRNGKSGQQVCDQRSQRARIRMRARISGIIATFRMIDRPL
jgi:hypothetical protein